MTPPRARCAATGRSGQTLCAAAWALLVVFSAALRDQADGAIRAKGVAPHGRLASAAGCELAPPATWVEKTHQWQRWDKTDFVRKNRTCHKGSLSVVWLHVEKPWTKDECDTLSTLFDSEYHHMFGNVADVDCVHVRRPESLLNAGILLSGIPSRAKHLIVSAPGDSNKGLKIGVKIDQWLGGPSDSHQEPGVAEFINALETHVIIGATVMLESRHAGQNGAASWFSKVIPDAWILVPGHNSSVEAGTCKTSPVNASVWNTVEGPDLLPSCKTGSADLIFPGHEIVDLSTMYVFLEGRRLDHNSFLKLESRVQDCLMLLGGVGVYFDLLLSKVAGLNRKRNRSQDETEAATDIRNFLPILLNKTREVDVLTESILQSIDPSNLNILISSLKNLRAALEQLKQLGTSKHVDLDGMLIEQLNESDVDGIKTNLERFGELEWFAGQLKQLKKMRWLSQKMDRKVRRWRSEPPKLPHDNLWPNHQEGNSA